MTAVSAASAAYIVAGLLFMPVFHLVLHRFHLDVTRGEKS